MGKRIKSKFATVGLTLLAGVSIMLSGCSKLTTNNSDSNTVNSSDVKISKTADSSTNGLSKATYEKLANTKFENGTYGYVKVNGDKSTLNPSSWKTNKVEYQNLDKLNRTSSSNTGYLEKRNLANGSLRVRQYIQPTGWHYNTRNGEQLYNRGHLIAYSVSAGIDKSGKYNPNNESGDQNNPKNLFTQSAYSNQQLQTIYEKKVRNALKANKKVIFQATPIFKGNEKMARGINLQAISTDKSLNFNVYIFNIQPGYKFNYTNGRASKDSSVKVKELPAELQSHYNNSSNRSYTNSSSNHSYSHYRRRNRRSYENSSQADRDFNNFTDKQLHSGKKYYNKAKKWIKQTYDDYKNDGSY